MEDTRSEGYPFVFVDWVDSCEPVPNSDITAYELPEPQKDLPSWFLGGGRRGPHNHRRCNQASIRDLRLCDHDPQGRDCCHQIFATCG